jgi:hypothetical protein
MKEQHKDMMRRLKSGEFDEKAFSVKAQLIKNYEIPLLEPEIAPPVELSGSETIPPPLLAADFSLPFESPQSETGPFELPDEVAAAPRPAASDKAENLDDAVLSFFGKIEK